MVYERENFFVQTPKFWPENELYSRGIFFAYRPRHFAKK